MAMKKSNYSPEWYTPRNLERVDLKEVRSEYSRLRDIAQKRLKRIKDASTGVTDWTRTEAYKTYRSGVPKLSEVSKEHLPYELSKLARWVESDHSRIGYLKKRMKSAIKELHEKGYSFIDESNYLDFTEFMEEYRRQKLDHVYGSPDAVELYGALQSRGISAQEVYDKFYDWLDNKEAFLKTRVKNHGTLRSYKMMLSRSGRWKSAKRNSGR